MLYIIRHLYTLKQFVIEIIYSEATRTGNPVLCTVLNYAFVMHNKSISKTDIVQNITKKLPVPPVVSYFLCDCWYVSEKIINTFAQKSFYTIDALKTNRLLYPSGMKKKLF